MRFLFTGHVLDIERRELRRGAELIAIEPQVFDVLVYLVRNRDRMVSKDDLIASVWQSRIISESTLTSRINAARKAVGDNGEDQRLIRTIPRKGFRFVGAVTERENPSGSASSALSQPPTAPSVLRQDIHFCVASDNVRIAYAEVGQGSNAFSSLPQ